jgi:hypothetical protein
MVSLKPSGGSIPEGIVVVLSNSPLDEDMVSFNSFIPSAVVALVSFKPVEFMSSIGRVLVASSVLFNNKSV